MQASPADAIAWCKDQSRDSPIDWSMLCLGMVAAAWDVHPTGSWPNAWNAFKRADHIHEPGDDPPLGAPVWFDVMVKGQRLGHVAVAGDPGFCWSIDFARPGKVDRVRVKDISTRWGAYVGWTTDLEGFDLPITAHGPGRMGPRGGSNPGTTPGSRGPQTPRGDDMILTRFQCTDALAVFIGSATGNGVANFVEWADPDTERLFAPFIEARRDITVDQCKSFHLLGPLPIGNDRTWTDADFRRHTPLE